MIRILVGACFGGAAVAGFLGWNWLTVPVLAVVILGIMHREVFPLTPIHGLAGPVGSLVLAVLLAAVLVALAFGGGRLVGLVF